MVAGSLYTRHVPAPLSIPHRPASVPSGAVWEDEHQIWRVGECDAEGRWQGPQFTYRSNGSLQGEYVYIAGKPDGDFRRYHPNGEVSMEGEHRLGGPVGQRVMFRSSGESDEAVHGCCMPRGSVRVVTHYLDDGRFLDEYFDAQGRRILSDGSAYPARPESVPAHARFELSKESWVDGTYERAQPHGRLTWWSRSGILREVAHYKHGQLEGLRERYLDGECVERRMYKAGLLDGPAWERVGAGRFERAEIAAREGFYEKGEQTAKWRYLDAMGQILATVDLGGATSDISLDDAVLRTITPQDTLCLDPAREHCRALLFLSHYGNTSQLEAAVAAVPQLTGMASTQWLSQLRDEVLEPPRYIAKLLQALLRGARAEHVFRALAGIYHREPGIGLQLLQVSLRLAPHEVETRATEVLLLTGLGRLAEVQAKITALAESHPIEAEELAFNARVTFPTFDYWPDAVALGPNVSPELPSDVSQGLEAMTRALRKSAARLQQVRASLVAYRLLHDHHDFAIPPDMSHWLGREPLVLETYSFENEGDQILVDEQLSLDGHTLVELMLLARCEWTTWCWLQFACGASSNVSPSQPSFPTTLEPNARFAAAITQAFQDLYRATDQIKTSGIRSRRQGIPECEWEGVPMSRLSRGLLIQAFAEYRERRAALYFAADATCRSVWQDDLRVV